MVLGIDFGTAKIGLAVSDITRNALPLALSILLYKDHQGLHEKLADVISNYNIDTFVVGALPDSKAGDEEKRERFAAFITLLDEFDLPIIFVDEQRSTKAAKSFGKDDPEFSTKKDDALAAVAILETYLATHGSTKN